MRRPACRKVTRRGGDPPPRQAARTTARLLLSTNVRCRVTPLSDDPIDQVSILEKRRFSLRHDDRWTKHNGSVGLDGGQVPAMALLNKLSKTHPASLVDFDQDGLVGTHGHVRSSLLSTQYPNQTISAIGYWGYGATW